MNDKMLLLIHKFQNLLKSKNATVRIYRNVSAVRIECHWRFYSSHVRTAWVPKCFFRDNPNSNENARKTKRGKLIWKLAKRKYSAWLGLTSNPWITSGLWHSYMVETIKGKVQKCDDKKNRSCNELHLEHWFYLEFKWWAFADQEPALLDSS